MKTFWSILLMLLANFGYAQKTVSIKGHLSNLDSHNILVIYQLDNKRVKDTVTSRGNHFELTLPLTSAQELSISPIGYEKVRITGSKLNSHMYVPPMMLFVQPGDQISLSGDARRIWESEVAGTTDSEAINKLNKQLTPLITQDHLLTIKHVDYINKGDKAGAKTIAGERSKLKTKHNSLTIDFFTANPGSLFAIYKFSQKAGSMQADKVAEIFASYPKNLQESVFGQKISKFIALSKRTGLGQNMIDFTGQTLDGKAFDSKSLRGKYVLLDFWGSWCKPCRASHPHLLALYQKYKLQGFEIVGIAHELGSEPEMYWSKAVEKDNINWIHLLNNQLKKNGNQDLVRAYNVGAFPTKILISPEGKIVWRGSGSAGAELDNQLINVFNK